MGGYEMYFTATIQDNPTPQPELFQLFEEEPGGSRPPCLGELWGSQERVQLRIVEQLADVVPMVQILGRRGGISWWLLSCTSIRRFPSRSPKCPRSRRHPVVAASSWWLGGERGTGECVFLVYRLTWRQAEQPPVVAEPGSIVMRQSTVAFRGISFPRFLARALRTLEMWCIISLWPCFWQLRVRCLGVACGLRKIGFFARSALTREQCLAQQWIHVLHQCLVLDARRTFSPSKKTRILRCSVSVLTQIGEVCSADASAFSRTWKSGHYLCEFHVADRSDDGGSVHRHWPT